MACDPDWSVGLSIILPNHSVQEKKCLVSPYITILDTEWERGGNGAPHLIRIKILYDASKLPGKAGQLLIVGAFMQALRNAVDIPAAGDLDEMIGRS